MKKEYQKFFGCRCCQTLQSLAGQVSLKKNKSSRAIQLELQDTKHTQRKGKKKHFSILSVAKYSLWERLLDLSLLKITKAKQYSSVLYFYKAHAIARFLFKFKMWHDEFSSEMNKPEFNGCTLRRISTNGKDFEFDFCLSSPLYHVFPVREGYRRQLHMAAVVSGWVVGECACGGVLSVRMHGESTCKLIKSPLSLLTQCT